METETIKKPVVIWIDGREGLTYQEQTNNLTAEDYQNLKIHYLVQDLKSYGFKCDDVYQGDNLWGVMQEAEGLMKDGKVCIGDNDLLKMHFLNSAVKMSAERGRGKLIKVSPTAHIDGMASLLDALTVRQKWYSELGAQLKNER